MEFEIKNHEEYFSRARLLEQVASTPKTPKTKQAKQQALASAIPDSVVNECGVPSRLYHWLRVSFPPWKTSLADMGVLMYLCI